MSESLLEIRKRLGLYQSEFALHLGITQAALSRLERGERPVERIWMLGVQETARRLTEKMARDGAI